ncbi:ATP-binding response regulator [Azospirillum canadense]|uniref:ATP-binding response regulator n=1 Tax=Azospirillum canadense TaxID=403962 RepID=UPI00222728BE|nr:ATP-binding protein [Azospirillum canadense]MCW2238321.1 signal transduction histidine kinase/ActR/RegA family two-component response regulator [Azospirillum canadense]
MRSAGACWGILEGPIGDPSIVQPLREGIAAATDTRVEFRHSGASGEDVGPDLGAVWLELRASPVRDDAGRLVSLIAIVRDITEHKNAQAALAEARREADRANVAKSKFLAAASHDLRQPVQSLLLLMEVLSARTSDAPTRKVLGTMDRALNALKMLLDGLLDVSKLEAGAVEPNRTVFPVAELMDRIAANSRPVAVRKGLVLHIMPCSAHVDSDPMLLGRILQNLVENALRYTAQGRILVGCRRRGAVLWIEVWDTGIGIPADRQDDIFQEFVQVGNASRDRDQGLGLGLAVVRRMAGILGHRITLRSAPGQGSVFRVEVPLAAVAPTPPAPADEPMDNPPSDLFPDPPTATSVNSFGCPSAEPPPPTPMVPPPLPKHTGPRILVVEDDPIVREGFRMMMMQWGHDVLAAETCAEALALVANEGAPDVIVTDYRLDGDRTGTEIIRDVRRTVGRSVPGILVTGDTAPERLAEAEAGNFRVLHKPVMAGDLQRAVTDALAGVEAKLPALAG